MTPDINNWPRVPHARPLHPPPRARAINTAAACIAHPPAPVAPAPVSAAKPSSSPPPPPLIHGWNTVIAQVQTLFQRLPTKTTTSFPTNSSPSSKRRLAQPRKQQQLSGPSLRAHGVQSAQRYMDARLAGHHDDVLQLVADNVVLTSSRDGRFDGKKSLREYMQRVKASGTWRRATWNDQLGVAQVEGRVRILMLNVAVMAHFGFDPASGKISRISIGTKKKVAAASAATVDDVNPTGTKQH